MPQRKSRGAAAYDVQCIVNAPAGQAIVPPGGTIILGTGLAVEMPPRWCIKALSRSGHGFKLDVSLSNSVGLMDEDFRGELLIKLRNDGCDPFPVKTGDHVAQFLFEPVYDVALVWADELSATEAVKTERELSHE